MICLITTRRFFAYSPIRKCGSDTVSEIPMDELPRTASPNKLSIDVRRNYLVKYNYYQRTWFVAPGVIYTQRESSWDRWEIMVGYFWYKKNQLQLKAFEQEKRSLFERNGQDLFRKKAFLHNYKRGFCIQNRICCKRVCRHFARLRWLELAVKRFVSFFSNRVN